MKNLMKLGLPFLALCVLLGFVLSISQNAKCDLESLLLQDNMMPLNWERLWKVLPPALPKDGAQDALEVVYENQNEIASHTIYRYKNGVFSFLFLRINDQLFFPTGLRKWFELAGSGEWSLSGDEVRIRCGDSDDPLLGYRCSAVVRYGPFISDFSSPIGDEIMSKEEFKKIVVSIDNQITQCIQPTGQQ
jgi:hypothetical protein